MNKKSYKPGENAPGGEYVEVKADGARGRQITNDPDHPKLPPTGEAGGKWEPVK